MNQMMSNLRTSPNGGGGGVLGFDQVQEFERQMAQEPINPIYESVIVSIRSLLVVGEGRLQAAASIPIKEREML